jgi:hypothetical protein
VEVEVDADMVEEKLEEEAEDEEEEENNSSDKTKQPSPGRWGANNNGKSKTMCIFRFWAV